MFWVDPSNTLKLPSVASLKKPFTNVEPLSSYLPTNPISGLPEPLELRICTGESEEIVAVLVTVCVPVTVKLPSIVKSFKVRLVEAGIEDVIARKPFWRSVNVTEPTPVTSPERDTVISGSGLSVTLFQDKAPSNSPALIVAKL